MASTASCAGVYELGKAGSWDRVLEAVKTSARFSRECAHFVKRSSGWTLLHQAAYFGNREAAARLIALGANPGSATKAGETPAAVAKSRGHEELAEALKRWTLTSVWSSPKGPDLLPSSNRWSEAQPRIAEDDMQVSYGGGVVNIRQGGSYYSDSIGRTLVGWHGSYNPPCGMDGESMC